MEIKEIKQKLSILKVLNYYGLKPDKNNMLHCPFHNDKTPSMKIYPETNTWTCFSSKCTAGTGDQIEMIQRKDKLNKHQAILKAASMVNGSVIQNVKPITKPVPVPASDEEREAFLKKMFSSFKKAVSNSRPAKDYLTSRHLNISEIEAGYNSGQFHHGTRKDETLIKTCLNCGLLTETGTKSRTGEPAYKPFGKSCIVFPLKNKENKISGLYFRSILPNTGNRHFYLKNRTGLYPEQPKPEIKSLILTESIIDAATLLQYPEITNKHNILALFGTNGLTGEHMEAIILWMIARKDKTKEITLFLDGDEAGQKAAEKYSREIKKITDEQLFIYTVDTPDNEDINSLLDGHDQEIFKHLINKRKLFLSIEKPLIEPEEPKEPEELKETGEPKQTETKTPKSLNNYNTITLNTNNPDYITLTTGELKLTVLGGINLQQLDRLRITLKITNTSTTLNAGQTGKVRNNIDLYNIDQTDRFINKAADKLETGSTTLNQAISELTDQLETYRLNKLEAMKTNKPKDRILSEERKNKAIKYLSSPELLKRTNKDIGKTGVIGEENNRLLMYLIFTSRLRKQPLHIISLGGSGTGKTYLQEKISELIPEQEKKEITILSENAFYYFEKTELKHKLVLIEDMDGAEQVLYPLRELQSKKKISKTVPIKDSKGNLKTITLNVEGPICLAGTTTKERLYEDNANRSILIYLDNSKEHKEEIMNYQRKLSASKIDTKAEAEIKELFKDIQTVLKPVKVRNPYAEQLKIPEHVFKPLRTNSHYLTFIETVTFYHQYQRQLKTDQETGEKYIETELEDIEEANKLIKDVLLAKSDELTKTVREFFEQLKNRLKKDNKQSFYSKEIQERLRIYPMKVNRYLRELESRNFIRRTGGNRKKGFEYEIYRTDEYTKLKSGMNILDEILNKIKQNKENI